MKIVYFSNVLGLRDIPDLSMLSNDAEFNQSMNELISAFWLAGETMTICQTDGVIIQWLDVENGALVGEDSAVILSPIFIHGA